MSDTEQARVQVSVADNGVAEVALSRPEKMNALDPAMFRGLADAIAQLKTDARVRVVVLHGQGRAFCAGLDFSSFKRMGSGASPGSGTMGDLYPRQHGPANHAQHVAWGWRTLAVPVIAAVHGVALGGGLQVALGADVRIVHPQAQMSVLEIKWGLVPDMAGMVLLSELVRPDVARALTYTGRKVGGAEAVAIGLATEASEDPLATAREMAAAIAASSPDAIRAAKRLHNLASPLDAQALLMAESYEQQRLIGSPNQVEAVKAGLEGRAAVFK